MLDDLRAWWKWAPKQTRLLAACAAAGLALLLLLALL